MRCFFVPKGMRESIKKAMESLGEKLSPVIPNAKVMDTFQRPLGDTYLYFERALQGLKEDRSGIDQLFGRVNARLQSPFPKVRSQGAMDAETAWIRFSHEAADLGYPAEKIQAELPTTPEQAASQAHYYATTAARLRFQRAGYKSGLLGDLAKRDEDGSVHPNKNYTELNFEHTQRGRGAYYGVLKQMAPRVAQVLHAYEPKTLADLKKKGDTLGMVGYGLKKINKTAIGLQMWSPFFHPVTILGRFLPTVLGPRNLLRGAKGLMRPWQIPGTLMHAIQELNRIRTDPAEAERLGRYQFTQLHHGGYESNIVKQLTSSLKTRGMTGQLAHAVIAGYKDAMSWAINNMGIISFMLAREEGLAKGLSMEAAEREAAKRATIIIGTIPEHLMTHGYNEIADFGLFSKRYTTSSWLTIARAMSKDRALASELKMMGLKPEEVEQAVKLHQKSFQALLLKDLALYYGVSNALNYMFTSMYNLPDKDGKRGGHAVWSNPGATAYSSWVNVRFVVGVDKVTGKVEYAQLPTRSIRDLAMMLLQLPMWLSGSDNFDPGAFQAYANKASPLAALASTLATGRDWRGKTLSMPTPGETTANEIGNIADIMQPLPVRDALVKGASLMSQGQYGEGVIKPWMDLFSTANLGQTALKGMGVQTSTADPVAAQFYRRQEAWRNWMSTPGIRADLKAGDPAMTQAYFNAAQKAGISYSEALATLARLRQGKVPKALQQLESQAQ